MSLWVVVNVRKVDYEMVISIARRHLTAANLTLRASRAILHAERDDQFHYLTGLWQIGIRWGPADRMWNTDLSVASVTRCLQNAEADLRRMRPSGLRNGRPFFFRSRTPFRFQVQIHNNRPNLFNQADHIKTVQSRGWDYWEDTFRSKWRQKQNALGGYRQTDFWLEYP